MFYQFFANQILFTFTVKFGPHIVSVNLALFQLERILFIIERQNMSTN